MNSVHLLGRLGADPETRTTQSGSTVANLSVATSERRKRGDQWEDHTEWHRVVCFGRTAENVARFLTKGSQVVVQGRITTEKWTDKEGRNRYTTKIVAERVHFVGSRGEGSGGSRRDPGPDTDLPF